MKADCNRMAEQADLYYKHNFDIGIYSESSTQKKFGSEPESVGVSKKNQDGSSSLNYMCQRMNH